VGRSHNGMARARIPNILNKRSRKADKGLSSSFGVRRGPNKSSP
jgi:hypothetical protein